MTYRERPDARAVAEARLREAKQGLADAVVAVAGAQRDVALAEADIEKLRGLIGALAEQARKLDALGADDAARSTALERRLRHERELAAAESALAAAYGAIKRALAAETIAKQLEADARAELARL